MGICQGGCPGCSNLGYLFYVWALLLGPLPLLCIPFSLCCVPKLLQSRNFGAALLLVLLFSFSHGRSGHSPLLQADGGLLASPAEVCYTDRTDVIDTPSCCLQFLAQRGTTWLRFSTLLKPPFASPPG